MLIALAASLLAVAAWVYLLAGHGGFWRTDQRLPPAAADPDGWPAVVAVIPARDEAAMLPETLPTLIAQDYHGPLTVVLVDDESTDGTAEVAAKLAAAPQPGGGSEPGAAAGPGGAAAGQCVRVISGEPPRPGWAGKVWAMNQGLRAADRADYVLFTDADIAYAPGTVSALVRAAEASDRVLVSQMALLRADTRAERLLIPAFVYFFAQLYPFRRINKPGGRTAAAAGGCMLVRRKALADAGGLEQIKGARIDDVALGGLLKRARGGGDCWLGFTTDVISKRQYTTLSDVWDMVARSAYTQLRYSPAALAGTVIGLAWLYLLPVAATVAGLVLLSGGNRLSGVPAWPAALLAAAGITGWALMSVSYLPILRLTGLSALRAPGLPLIAVLYAAMTISSAQRHHAGRGGEWKGRTIERGSRPRRNELARNGVPPR
jgi:hopene-associated glycosyltransferase HpnB